MINRDDRDGPDLERNRWDIYENVVTMAAGSTPLHAEHGTAIYAVGHRMRLEHALVPTTGAPSTPEGL